MGGGGSGKGERESEADGHQSAHEDTVHVKVCRSRFPLHELYTMQRPTAVHCAVHNDPPAPPSYNLIWHDSPCCWHRIIMTNHSPVTQPMILLCLSQLNSAPFDSTCHLFHLWRCLQGSICSAERDVGEAPVLEVLRAQLERGEGIEVRDRRM